MLTDFLKMSKEGRDEKGRFKEGNLFAVGYSSGGRPPKYSDPEKLHNKIAEYLEWEDQWKNKSAKGEGKGVYTLAGCALYLGFASVQSMYDYENKSPLFSYVINRFRLFMRHWNEQKLYWGGTFAGAKIWLTNFGGYTEESVQQINQTITAKYGGSSLHTPSESNNDTPSNK